MAEQWITAGGLQEGMVLSRDLMTKDGILLLSKDYLLDEPRIEQIRNYEKTDIRKIRIYVHTPIRSDDVQNHGSR